jgi:hypothetical protein
MCMCVCVCVCVHGCVHVTLHFSSDLTVYSVNIFTFMNFNEKQQAQHVVVMWYV